MATVVKVVIPQTCLNYGDVKLDASVGSRKVKCVPLRFSKDDNNVVFLRRRKIRNGGRWRQPRWWSHDNREEEEEGGGGNGNGNNGILQQLVHNLWILEVFKSYGLLLPIIFISLLLATGPKAFIMASAIFFGLSLLAFSFNYLSQSLKYNRTRSPSPFDAKWDFSMEGENTQQQQTRQPEKIKTTSSSFGGWDELVTQDKTDTTQRPSATKQRFEMMMMMMMMMMMIGKKLLSSMEEI